MHARWSWLADMLAGGPPRSTSFALALHVASGCSPFKTLVVNSVISGDHYLCFAVQKKPLKAPKSEKVYDEASALAVAPMMPSCAASHPC